MDDDRLQEALNRANETEAAQAGSNGTVRQGGERSARHRFRAIFRRALVLMALLPIVALAGIVAFLVSGPSNPPPLAELVIWGVVFFGLYAAWIVNWRCPVCGAYLGGGWWGFFSVRHCLKCGAELA